MACRFVATAITFVLFHDGAMGDVVSAKNAKSDKIIEGIVVGQDTISVLLQSSATVS